MGSNSNYAPVQQLNGVHAIELSSAAQNNIVKEPYLTSVSQNAITGVLDVGYNVSLGYGTYLCVTQPHYYNSQQSTTRDATAYYRVEVSRIDTNLLYRPERSEKLVAIVSGGIILIGAYSVLKWVRR